MTASTSYVVSLTSAEPRMIAAVHARLSIGDVPATFARYLDQVYAAARSGAIHLDGQNVFVYREIAERRNEAEVAFGVGVAASFDPIGNVRATTLPTGRAATTTHWGSYARLGAAHDAVAQWCRGQGHKVAGVRWEVYGHWTSDEARLRTDVFHLLA